MRFPVVKRYQIFYWTIALPSFCVQVGCEVPLDPGISAATIEYNHVVVKTEEQFTGKEH